MSSCYKDLIIELLKMTTIKYIIQATIKYIFRATTKSYTLFKIFNTF